MHKLTVSSTLPLELRTLPVLTRYSCMGIFGIVCALGLMTPNRKCLREVAEGLIISTYSSVFKCVNASYKMA